MRKMREKDIARIQRLLTSCMEVNHKRIGAHEPTILKIQEYIEAMYEETVALHHNLVD